MMAVEEGILGSLAMEGLKAPSDGFLYVFAVNETYTPVDFDNLIVTHKTGTVLEINDYYPFGLKWYSNGNNLNKYKFGGKELQTELNLNTYDFHARQQDPQLGRFWGIDPMAEKYFNQSSYLFCNGNPIIYTDPNGKDGIITINGGQINVTSNVYLYGAGATNAVAAQYQSDINSKWGGSYSAESSNGTSFNVNLNISVGLYEGQEKNNSFLIPEKFNPFNRDNFIEVGASVNRSFVLGGDEGQWRSKGRNGLTIMQDNPAAHEVGHLLGLDDRYTDKNGVNKGWEKNIMGDSQNGKVEQRNIDGILKDAMKSYDSWSKDKNNVGKEFKYEINVDRPNN